MSLHTVHSKRFGSTKYEQVDEHFLTRLKNAVLDQMRLYTKPITLNDLADLIYDVHGANRNERRMVQHCLKSLRQAGQVQVDRACGIAFYSIK